MKKIILLFICSLAISLTVYARPEYSIIQSFGARCINCHVRPEGGALRNNPGWLSRNDLSLLKPSTIGLGGLFSALQKTNTLFDDKVTFGMDLRYESAKIGSPTNSKRTNFLMQLSPYLAIKPVDWLNIDGSYNLAYNIEKDNHYPGQQAFSASLTVKPLDNMPSLRIGFFQPPNGVKYDDHTMMIYSGTTPIVPSLLPADYAEWGAELNYDPADWLNLSLGAFKQTNLASMGKFPDYMGNLENAVDSNSIATVFEAIFYPNLGHGINSFMGGSFSLNGGVGINNGFEFTNNYYYVGNIFFNIGLGDKFAVMTQYSASEKQFAFTTDNFLLEFDYQLLDAVMGYARVERATTRLRDPSNHIYAYNQYVLGGNIFILPYIEFTPEYRIFHYEDDLGFWSQWALQLHVFY